MDDRSSFGRSLAAALLLLLLLAVVVAVASLHSEMVEEPGQRNIKN